MIGSVAACAASDTPRLSASQRGSRPRPIDSIHAVSGVAQAISPAVASDESWKPGVADQAGSRDEQERRRPAEGRGGAARAAGLAREQHDAGHQRRAHDRRATPRRTRRTRRSRRSSRPTGGGARDDRPCAPIAAATIAMFQPEMATTWLTPAVVNAAARSRSTRSRRPMRMPAARPASGSGRTRVSASPAPRRSASRRRPRSSRRRLDARASATVSVPTAPIRSRYAPYGESGRSPDRRRRPTIASPGIDDRIARAAWRRPERRRRPAGVAERRGLLAVARRADRLDDEPSTGRRRRAARSSGGRPGRQRPRAGRR